MHLCPRKIIIEFNLQEGIDQHSQDIRSKPVPVQHSETSFRQITAKLKRELILNIDRDYLNAIINHSKPKNN